MSTEKPTIIFTLIYSGIETSVYAYRNQYYSLMTLISDYMSPNGFGRCSGMGSCGTCMIDIYTKSGNLMKSTLSCNMQIDDHLANSKIIVPEKCY